MRSAVNRLNRHQYSSKLLPTTNSLQHHTGSLNILACTNINNKYTVNEFSRPYSTRLAEVGRFEAKQPDAHCYPAGQPFLHRIFGYRGVTLFPWLARVHDTDLRKQYEPHTTDNVTIDGAQPPKFTNPQSTQFHPYYQVLIDTRDCPYVSNRTQTEAVTFLGHPDNSKSVYSIKGLDYVAHEDILPYTSHEEQPIQHELHKKLFRHNPDFDSPSKYTPSDLLDSWRSKHPWLELSRVYKETTENIRVTVIPFYLGHTTIEDTSFRWWRYCVRLENFSDASVQLRERHWKIFSQTNMLQTIKGRGVVGVEPLLTKSEPAYQYSSHVNLQDKSGHMWGTFKMQREDGYTFECRIPPFSLESSLDSSPPPTIP